MHGSLDGRNWGLLGGTDKAGRNKDIGCKLIRFKIKFLRFVFVGGLRGESRINYLEVASEGGWGIG